ncbi:MAG: two-component regulator propeller domain-containing protein [Chloroherpetonaceae bacterium]|nr:ATP-binding protein [Chloroherpetonaceae bacterium]MDW8019918.1 two-component regulator propeller domain-containing protein [Chloroherpetonaceae bacterium]MDW8466597.1 two-component regulator propeller domain-containing protein [Chloroherpetonaceae bacterium]
MLPKKLKCGWKESQLTVQLLCIWILLSTPLFALDPKKKITQYNYEVWEKKDGLPHQSVLAVLQTQYGENNGYIWLGSYDGLIRFDGARFVVFNQRNTPAFQNSTVLALKETADSAIWIGTNGGGLLRFKAGRFEVYQVKDGLPSNIITSIGYDSVQNLLWLGTRKGLVKLDWRTGKITTYTISNGLPSNSINVVVVDSKGVVWAGTDLGLWKLENGVATSFTSKTKVAPLPNDFVRTIYEDRSGNIWIGTNAGMARFEQVRWVTYSTQDGLVNEIVYSIFQDSGGALWVGTIRGLARFYGGKFENFTEKEGFEGMRVYAFCEDREGSLWFGTSRSGLNRFRDGKFLTFGKLEGLADDVTYSIYQDRDGSMWFGSFNGMTHWKDGKVQVFTTREGLPTNIVRAFLRAKDNKFWIATFGGGILQYDGKSFKALTRKDGLADNGTRTIVEDYEGALWVGTNIHGLSRYKDGKFTTFTTVDGLTHNSIIALYCSSDSTIWIATDGGGLNYYKNGKFAAYTSQDNLSGDVVFTVYEDKEHTIWVGTSGGLSRIKEGRITAYTSKDGLYGNDVFQILEDDEGYLWMNCNTGIFCVSKAELTEFAEGKRQKISSRAFGTEAGMKTNEGITPASACKDRDGMLWFPTAKGAVRINPKDLPKNPIPPPVHIEEIYVDNQLVEKEKPMVFRAGTSKLEFHYTGLSLLAPKKVRFRYQLVGFDKDWNNADTRREAYYTNLPPNTYTFRVIACNNDGVWNKQGATVTFTIEPFFYQTTWFLGIVSVSLVLLGVGISRWRVASIVRREKELSVLVEKRTQDLAIAKERLEIALQEARQAQEEMEIKRYEAEALRQKAEEANRMKTELLSVVAHDLKNPLQSILGLAMLIQERTEPNSDIYLMVQTILNAADRILKSIDGLLEAAALEEGKIELRKTLCDLSRLAEEVIAYNKVQAQSKNQNIVFEGETGCTALVDPDRMREVLENLISNAIKYSPEGKTIWVCVKKIGEEDAQTLQTAKALMPRSVLISVRDEGQGLSETDLQKLFGKFQRLSARPTGGESSTGLGLSIVKQLVEMHGGKVWAESEGKGKGSIFYINLPIAKESL